MNVKNYDNVEVFQKWNYIEPDSQPGYTIFFGNWGTYYSGLTKEQLLKFYPRLLRQSRYNSHGDLYVWFNGQCIRSVNWQNAYEFIITKK